VRFEVSFLFGRIVVAAQASPPILTHFCVACPSVICHIHASCLNRSTDFGASCEVQRCIIRWCPWPNAFEVKPPAKKMQLLQIAAKPSVLFSHLVNTNEELGGLAMPIKPFWQITLVFVGHEGEMTS